MWGRGVPRSRRSACRAWAVPRLTGLAVAILAVVHHLDLGEASPVQGAVEQHVGTDGRRAPTQGHVLVIDLIGRGPTAQETGRVKTILVAIGPVVVGDLVIVPGHHPGGDGVSGLQQGVGLVGGVADAISGHVLGLGVGVQPHRALAAGIALVDVVAEEHHNGGKLVVGNFGTAAVPDYKLIYSVGDKGSNQFGNACDSIESQYTPTAAQMAANDIHRYNGKILRMNLNGSIPADNPVINGVRTHIYTYGHRNPQGLSFEKKANNPMEVLPGGKLYESEQGPATNDEINIIEGVKNNYGWPRIAGKKDNNWYRYFQWSKIGGCTSYGGECSTNQTTSPLTESTFSSPDLTDPIFDLYAGTPSGGTSCNWLAYPTIAPSSIIHYPFNNKIPGWDNSLLITTLKTSSVFRLKLNAAGTAPALTPGATGNDSVVQYFKFPALNRYRDIALGNDGITFYLLTDSVGTTSGPSAGSAGVTDRGRVLEFIYLGSVLSVANNTVTNANRISFKMYPNPVSEILTVESKRNTAKPLHYQLYDAAGRMLLQGRSTKDKFEVDVKALMRGVYVIKIFNGYQVNIATEKIVVN